MRVAAIDVGTNTTRLLIAETTSSPQRYRDLDRQLRFTRLGQGVDSDRTIKPEAIRRTLDAISAYCAICGEVGVERIRLAATSAMRDARNRGDFVGPAREIAGVEPEILEGDAEAALSFRGAVDDLEPGNYAVCDIGGGSTELIAGSSSDFDDGTVAISLDIGSVRLSERLLRSDPPTSEELGTLTSEITRALADADGMIAKAEPKRFVGVAGTVTSLAALQLGLKVYDAARTHHFRLSRGAVEGLYTRLSQITTRAREKLPAMPPGRADVIVAGSCILLTVMERWWFDEVIVSERDILDGLVLEMIG